MLRYSFVFFFFFKQKTAYEITTGDWSSDVCSSDLLPARELATLPDRGRVILRDHKNIGTRNPEVRSIDHRNIAAGKRISETRRCVNNEGVQPVLAKRRDVI